MTRRVTFFAFSFVSLFAFAARAETVPLSKGFEPNPKTFAGLAGEATQDASAVGIPNCNTKVPATPSLTIDLKDPIPGMIFLQATPTKPNRLNLVVRFSDGSAICGMAKDAGPTSIRTHGVPAGKVDIWVGHAMAGAKYSFDLLFLEYGRTKEVTLKKDFSPNPMTIDGLSGRTTQDASKFGLSTGQCSDTFTETPGVVIDAPEGLGPEVKFSLTGPVQMGAGILVRTSDGNAVCYSPVTIAPGSIVVKNAPPGKIEVYAGGTQGNAGMVYSLSLEDLGRAKAAKEAAYLASPEGKLKDFCGGGLSEEPAAKLDKISVAGAAILNTVCTGPRRGYSWAGALRHGLQEAVDKGETNPVYFATLVAACRDLPDQYYYGWRQCRREADKLGDAKALDAAIDAALAGIPKAAIGKELFLGAYDSGTKRLAALAPAMTEHEKGYPNEKAVFDDVAKTVETKYRPMFKQWGGTLHDVDAWYADSKKGPGFVAGCEEKWRRELQRYVNEAVKHASGDALAEALWSPVGHRLVVAMAVCEITLGKSADPGVSAFLRGGRSYNGTYEMTAAMLAERAFVRPEFEKMPFSSWTRSMGSDDEADPLEARAGGPWYKELASFKGGDDVVATSPRGANVTITFKHVTGKDVEFYDCKEGKIIQIDANGYLHREEHCKERPITVDQTTKPVTVPKADAARVAPGTKIHFTRGDREGDARVIWVKRGNDLVWAMGVSAPAK